MPIWCVGIPCWIPKATNTHSQFVIIIIFHCYNGYTNAHRYYVIRTCLSSSSFLCFLCFLHCLQFLFRKITISSVTRVQCSAIHLTLFNVTRFGFLNKAIIRQTNQSKKSHSVRYKICFILGS